MYIINVESGQLTRVPPAAAADGGGGRGRGGAGGGGGGFGGGSMVFARDGRTLYFRSGSGLYAATLPTSGAGAAARPAAAAADAAGAAARRARRRRHGGRSGSRRTQTARQVTYTANLEVDHKALRAQVFNEGWRIMKNRFYDAKMHGADWNGAWETYGALLDHVVDEEELHTLMMMMIGQLNASHTGVSGGPSAVERTQQTRYPGFDLVADASGFYKVGTSTRTARPITTT